MTAPSTLLDRTFLTALASGAHPHHAPAVEAYRELVDRYERNEVLLLARDDHLAEHPSTRRTLLAPVETVHVAGQHRHAGEAMLDSVDDLDLAITLVLLRRERIHSIATFDLRLDGLDPELVVLRPVTDR